MYTIGMDDIEKIFTMFMRMLDKTKFGRGFRRQVGQLVAQYRKEAGLNQQELAKRLGKRGRGYVSALERGHHVHPSVYLRALKILAPTSKWGLELAEIVSETKQKLYAYLGGPARKSPSCSTDALQ